MQIIEFFFTPSPADALSIVAKAALFIDRAVLFWVSQQICMNLPLYEFVLQIKH